MKRKILFLIIGFVLILVWSLCFVSAKQSDEVSSALGLSFTVLAVYFAQREFEFKLGFNDKLCLLFFPVVYWLVFYYNIVTKYFKNFEYSFFYKYFYIHLIFPLNVALFLMLLGMSKMKDVTRPVNIFIFFYIILFYSYFFFSDWHSIQFASLSENFKVEDSTVDRNQSTVDVEIGDKVNLKGFFFINSSLDTVVLGNSSKYILLETWNETCLPCIKAMKELPDFYKSIQGKVEVYYLYENDDWQTRRRFERIFGFKNIEDKSMILIDINQGLYQSLGMKGYPYFLLFNPSGQLVFQKSGYSNKDEFCDEILALINN